jgi:hypothetical protein
LEGQVGVQIGVCGCHGEGYGAKGPRVGSRSR